MISPLATQVGNSLLQTTTSTGTIGSISWKLVVTFGILGAIVVGAAWFLTGSKQT